MNIQEHHKLRSFEEVPVAPHQRRRTDICCTIISSLLVLTMFIIASRWAYPTDSSGKLCGYDYIDQPFLYFASVSDTSKRLCLSQCPVIGDNQIHSYPLNCYPNILQDTHVQIYNTQLQETKMGSYCFPVNPLLKQNILQKSGILDRYRVLQGFKTVLYSLLIALIIGIFYMFLVQVIPEIMMAISVILGGIALIVFGILLLVFDQQSYPNMIFFRKTLSAISIFFGLILLGTMFFVRRQLKLTGVFIRQAGKFVKNRPIVYLVIVVFLILVILLVGLFFFQFLAFFSLGQMGYNVQSPFYELKSSWSSGILQFLNIIQFIWGLNFLRQASVFTISGLTAEWYTKKTVNPVRNLICYHWGSVVACSFMVGFFGIPDMIYLLFSPQPSRSKLNGCGRICSFLCSPFEAISTYIRQQSMTYINLASIPYCNASVYSQFLNWYSFITRGKGSRPIMRYYRYASYAFLLSIILIFSVVYLNNTIGISPFLSLLTVCILSLFVISAFVDIHADAGSAIMLTLMLEQHLSGSIDNVVHAPPQLISILKHPKFD